MAKCVVKMSSKGIEAVLSSPGVQADLAERGGRIKEAADASTGAVFAVKRRKGRKGGRLYVAVAANSRHARAKNAAHNTLMKCLDRGR